MSSFTFRPVHIDTIVVGDVVFHDGHERTVSRTFLKRGGFHGTSLWGDNYHSGHKPVMIGTPKLAMRNGEVR